MSGNALLSWQLWGRESLEFHTIFVSETAEDKNDVINQYYGAQLINSAELIIT